MKYTKCCGSYKINGKFCPMCNKEAIMVNDEDIIEEQEEERDYLDLPICSRCNGSGEGMWDGSRCSSCNGSGEVKPKIDESW